MPATARKVRKTRILTKDDHAIIQQKCGINLDTENYTAVIQKGKAVFQWSIHVFAREATLPEINKYEQTASRVEFKGQKAKIEGSQILAASDLYNKLIARAYDVLVGLKKYDQLDAQEARTIVPPLVKREAIRELIGEVYSSSRMEEIEGADGDDDEDDDPEDHTSTGSED